MQDEDGYDAVQEWRNYKESYARDEAKQAFTSLIKELVAEAKPEEYGYSKPGGELVNYIPALQFDSAIDQFEQNLLKALEEE
jgi:hypothetical protein